MVDSRSLLYLGSASTHPLRLEVEMLMPSVIFIAAVLLTGVKPIASCPRPHLINIDLNFAIDRGVFKRTFLKCRRQYKKSPCLVKLVQPEKGAFHAICGEVQAGLIGGLSPDAKLEDVPQVTVLEINCSAENFTRNLAADWALYQSYPIVAITPSGFCGGLD